MKNINLKKYFENRKDRISFFGVSPTFDWRFILSIFVLVIICGSIYGGVLYMNIINESLFKSDEDPVPLNQIKNKQGEIHTVIEKIENRNFDEKPLN